jgi:hypothetical protein
MTQHQNVVNNEFDAAKIIVETLTGLERLQQERAIRFASEALGLKAIDAIVPSQKQADLTAHPQNIREPARAIDIKQFTETKSPSSDQQFAAVVAYFYQFEAPPSEHRETINADVLGEAARLATRRRPSRHALNNAKNAGYLDSAGHGEFRLNTVGENLVAMTLPRNAGGGGAKRLSRSKKIGASRKSSVKKKKKKT